MKKLILLLLPFILLINVSAQDKLPSWVHKSSRDTLYPSNKYYQEFAKWENVKNREAKSSEKRLTENLKKRLSEKIITLVSSSSTLSKSENNQGYSEVYKSKTDYSTKTQLVGVETYSYFDKKKDNLYCLVVINKAKLGNYYQKLLSKKLNIFSNELRLYNVNASAKKIQQDIDNFNQRLRELEQDYGILISTDVAIDNHITTDFSFIRSKINTLYEVLSSSETEEYIQHAQSLYFEGRILEALKAFKIAKIKLPNDQRIQTGIQNAEEELEKQHVNKANNYSNMQQFEKALKEYEVLFSHIPDLRAKYKKTYNKLVENSFEQYADKLEFHLKNSTIPEIESALNDLKKYQHVDRDKYNKYYKEVNEALALDYYTRAKIKYHEKLYLSCINTVNKAIAIDPDVNAYVDLKEDAQKALYKADLKELRQEKPNQFCLQLGVGAQSQNTLYESYSSSQQLQYILHPVTSLGLYKKINIREKIWTDGTDRSKSNLIGLKYTRHFSNITYDYSGEFDFTDFKGLDEFELALGFWQSFIFNVGMVNTKPISAMGTPDLYSTALSFRLPMQPFELQLMAKTYFDTELNFYPVAQAGLYLNLNFFRKVSRHEKVKIKYNVEN